MSFQPSRNELLVSGAGLIGIVILGVAVFIIMKKTPKDERKKEDKKLTPYVLVIGITILAGMILYTIHSHRQRISNRPKSFL